jgi:hypothetical protein
MMADAGTPMTFSEMYSDTRTRLVILCRNARRMPDADKSYIDALISDWDKILAEHEAMPAAQSPMPEEALAAYKFLSESVSSWQLDPDNPDVDEDALLSWVDAFPDAIVDLGESWSEAPAISQ